LVERAGGRPVVFHRAFDATADPFEALEALIDLGFTRVLTGGHQRRAIDGIDQLRALVERAAGRIEILPGGSVRADNAAEIVARTGADQIHLAPVEFVEDPTWPGGYGVIRAAAVAEVVAAVRASTE
jgi:copper homeostasis protein